MTAYRLPLRPLLPLVMGLLFSASAAAQNYPPIVTDFVNKARSQVKVVDAKTFKAMLDRKATGLIVDVREPAEFAEGHVPGAINLPRGQLEFRIWNHLGYPEKLDVKKKVTVYCGNGYRSLLAAKTLKDLKLADVTAVDMKFEEWTRAKYPVAAE
jgi:rhodanese-related sulfurtransferase